MKIHIERQIFKEIHLETCSVQTESYFASNPRGTSTRINMAEPKNSMNVNPVRAANIKVNALRRHLATEQFA